MEPVSWLLVLSLLFGGWQYGRANDAQAEADKWQEHAQLNYKAATEAKIANDSLTAAITQLEETNGICADQLHEALSTIHVYEESKRIRWATITQLQDKLAQSRDVVTRAVCRVPDWVVLEGVETPED